MSQAFKDCVKRGGKVRTTTHGEDSYQHICYLDGKSYPGEVKVHKKKRTKHKHKKKGRK